MDLGIFTYNTEYMIRIDHLAKAAEERGCESLWVPEHTHIPASRDSAFPGGGDLPREYIHMSDPFTSLAAAAAVTDTIKLGTAISLVNQHDPIALAKQVATLDRLCDGRFIFGVGAGWNAEEMANHGIPFKKRWKALRERVEAMKAMWTEEEASYHGEFVNFDRIWSYPKPLQTPHPPILIGTFASELGRQRVANYGDGWIPVMAFFDDLPTAVNDLHGRLAEAGRDPQSVGVSVVFINQRPTQARLEKCVEAGAQRIVLSLKPLPRDAALEELDGFVELVGRL
ncbi:MAG: LLM class F420-dependent oxidoreductase [Gammaproteobacteria bacterium]|nr:LLM class F420-dependent oxidoreductase [Gammaproteobacteria bacterium]